MNPHLKQLWAAMRLPENFKKSYKFFCRGLDIRVTKVMEGSKCHFFQTKKQGTFLQMRDGGADRILDSHGLRKELKKYVFTRKNQYGLKNVLSMWISD